jgi:hypothetical protein
MWEARILGVRDPVFAGAAVVCTYISFAVTGRSICDIAVATVRPLFVYVARVRPHIKTAP